MACPNLGKEAKVALGANKVARMTALTININNENQDVTEFGDDYQFFCQTIANWTASVEGYYDRSDTYQDEMHSIAASAGEVQDIRLYEDATNYWTPDTVTDADSTCFIEAWTMNADPSGIVTFSMTLKGSGPILRTT